MPSMAGAGAAGFGESVDDLMTRILKEQALKEETRHNTATEGLQGRQIDESAAGRKDALQARIEAAATAERDRQDTRILGQADKRPIGADVSGPQMRRELRAGTSEGNYKAEMPDDTIGLNPTDPKKPVDILDMESIDAAPTKQSWAGTQGEITAAKNADRETGSSVHDTPEGLVRVHQDGRTEPVLGQDGKQVKGYHAAPQPVVINTSTGPNLLDKGTGIASPIKGKDGTTVEGPIPATVKDKQDQRARASTQLDALDKDIDNASGELGPAMGRISDLEQHIGDASPALMRVATRFLASKMLVDAGIGGMRGAASPQLLARWDNLLANKVTPASLHSVVQVMREMVANPDKSDSKGTDTGYDPYGLLGGKK